MMKDANDGMTKMMTDGPGMAYNPNAEKSPMAAMSNPGNLNMMSLMNMTNSDTSSALEGRITEDNTCSLCGEKVEKDYKFCKGCGCRFAD